MTDEKLFKVLDDVCNSICGGVPLLNIVEDTGIPLKTLKNWELALQGKASFRYNACELKKCIRWDKLFPKKKVIKKKKVKPELKRTEKQVKKDVKDSIKSHLKAINELISGL